PSSPPPAHPRVYPPSLHDALPISTSRYNARTFFICRKNYMKFRFLLWMLGRLMGKASRTNLDFQQQLGDKDLTFQLHTLDGKVADRKSTRLNSSHVKISYAVFCLK